jgi:uncharacterized membrane protein YeaQ/YmgE (transglycosylase-associated protein family)
VTEVLRRLSPWSPAESRRLLLLVVVGLVVVTMSWWIVSREAAWGDQTNGMVLGVAGAMVAAYGVSSWLLRARALFLRHRAAVFARIEGADAVLRSGRVAARAEPVTVESFEVVVAHPTQGRFHRPGCALTQGQGWPAVRREDLVDRRPCGVCRP